MHIHKFRLFVSDTVEHPKYPWLYLALAPRKGDLILLPDHDRHEVRAVEFAAAADAAGVGVTVYLGSRIEDATE